MGPCRSAPWSAGPGPRLDEGLLTHLERAPVDVEKARRQWLGYAAALQAEGWELYEVEPADDCPDAVFVEDTAVVYGDLAVITRPGADQRKPETAGTEDALAGLGYRIAHIEEPGTLDGGDVLKHGGTVWVGLGGRTNQAGLDQLARPPRAARRHRGRRTGHQGAAPQVRGHRAPRRHRDRLRPARRRPGRVPGVPLGPGGAGAHVVLLDGETVLMSTSAPRTQELFESRGLRVVAVDISEYEKLEGCVTCLSIRLRGLGAQTSPFSAVLAGGAGRAARRRRTPSRSWPLTAPASASKSATEPLP